MSFENEFPRWENEGASPPEAKKDDTGGWEPEEKPPAGWFNWFWNKVFKAGQETQQIVSSHLSDYVKHGELIAFPGHYVVTEFDTPTEGDIQQKMYKSEDDSLVVTYTTEFDEPTEGDIKETVETADGEIYNEKITEFDEPTEGDIKETVSEVSA